MTMRKSAAENSTVKPASASVAALGNSVTATAAVPFGERLSCTIAEACAATGLGRTKLYELIGAGCVKTTTIGRRRLVIVRSLRDLLLESGA